MDLLFSAETRMYELEWRADSPGSLRVEAWWACEALSAGLEIRVDCLSTDAFLELKCFMGQVVTLVTTLVHAADERGF